MENQQCENMRTCLSLGYDRDTILSWADSTLIHKFEEWEKENMSYTREEEGVKTMTNQTLKKNLKQARADYYQLLDMENYVDKGYVDCHAYKIMSATERISAIREEMGS